MIIVLKQGSGQKEIEEITKQLQGYNVKTNPIIGAETTIIGLVGDTSRVDVETLKLNGNVEKIVKVQEPFKRTNRQFHPEASQIDVGGVTIGGNTIAVMAGPCSVESKEQICAIAQSVKESGATILRGGAFKPRSSPYAFQGLKAEGLVLLKEAKKETGLPIISEITNPFYLDLFMENVDIIQVGARNMQNFELLKELGRVDKPILLKRGFSNTMEELLMSAEYIVSGGNENVILCERGIRTFENYTRNTLDISAVPMLKKKSHLPVVIDPSHAGGINWLVEPLALAGVAAGCDGLIIEVHNCPECALCDGAQSLTPQQFQMLMPKLKAVANAIGRDI